MKKKTTQEAFKFIEELKSELQDNVIKDFKIPSLYSVHDANKETGFAVILTVSNKYEYTSDIIDSWRKRFGADDFIIGVYRNQLKLRFNVKY